MASNFTYKHTSGVFRLCPTPLITKLVIGVGGSVGFGRMLEDGRGAMLDEAPSQLRPRSAPCKHRQGQKGEERRLYTAALAAG